MQPSSEAGPMANVPAPPPVEVAHAQEFLNRTLSHKAPVTWGLIIINTALFGLEWYWGDGNISLAAQRMGAGSGAAVLQGEVWRLLSASMLHASTTHLLVNSLALWSFGTFVEKVLGSARFLSIFVFSAFAGSALSALRIDTTSVGASGGIWGLMMAGAALVTWPKGVLPDVIAGSMRNRVWVPVGINALISFAPGIDFLAHGGGGLTGFALVGSGLLLRGLPKAHDARPRVPSRAWGTTAFILGALQLSSVGAAIVTGKPWELHRPTFHTVKLEPSPLEIDLPSSFPSVEAQRDNGWVFTWDRFKQDGLFVVLAVASEDVDFDETVFLEEMRHTIASQQGLTTVDPPRISKLDGHSVVLFSSRPANSPVLIRHTIGLVGKRPVRLETFSSDALTDPWKKLEHELFLRIRTAKQN